MSNSIKTELEKLQTRFSNNLAAITERQREAVVDRLVRSLETQMPELRIVLNDSQMRSFVEILSDEPSRSVFVAFDELEEPNLSSFLTTLDEPV